MGKHKSALEKLSNSNLLSALEAILPYGLTSRNVLKAACGMNEKQASYALVRLRLLGMIEQLQSASVYAVKNGRPEQPYALTPMGASALQEMGYKNAARLDLDGALDVSHRFCMALVGSQSAKPVQIEKVLPYAPGCNVRTDVYVPVGEGLARLVEIEQALDSNHKSRAVAKLKNYADLFATGPSGIVPEMMIVFNLPEASLPRTMKIWQSALRDAGDLPLTVYYSTLADFLAAPNFADWSGFERLTPSEKKRGRSEEAEKVFEEPLGKSLRNEIPMAELVGMIQTDAPLETDDEDAMRLYHLGALAYAVHQLDFGENGRTSMYAAHPVNSLGSLRQFLRHPNHLCLLELMKREMRVFNKQNGITMVRNAATRLAWSFLRYFGFGRGGPLTLYVRVPEMGDNISEIYFELRLIQTKNSSLTVPQPLEKSMQAISWLLSALIIHSEELGLVDE
ncbi:MAG: hypothetical protein HYR70_04195 [Chloroflexi bacterium]|nr:hypothetical protein [Chloroflexota bacterium]MBI3340757.1 hypothetical protein [Chloroflexota bacterium]